MSETVHDEQGRPDPPADADEAANLLGFLDFLRATMAWKVTGVDDAALHQRCTVSTMTLAGLLNHLAYVEDFWFSRVLTSSPAGDPWNSVDWSSTPDWDWESAREMSPVVLRRRWQDSVDRSRRLWQQAVLDPMFALSIQVHRPGGETVSVRWLLTHMIEEYARHCGHADILREAIDGQVGE
ncbi:DinB family protein [Luteococcus sp.]|uniref:DinB family protein n=1 Tax=Luteococcus sp. TaxID=1969402 RepID=UPI00373523B4